MNQKRLVLLLGLTVAAVVLVALLGRDGGSEGPETGPLVPGLSGAVNELEALDIIAPGGNAAVSLRRDESRWRLPQKDGYEADFAQVQELLRSLARANTVDARTRNPDWYPRLGVSDVDSDDATGRRLDFPGRELPSVIIGQTDPTDGGSYARRAGEEQSWLLDEIIEVPVDAVDWLEPGIMDIPATDVAEVEIVHPDGETVTLRRAGDEGENFVLMEVPEGRDAGPGWERTATANGMRGLNLQDVRRFEPPLPEHATRVRFVTTDDLEFTAHLFERDDARWAHFTVAALDVSSEEDGAADAEADDAPAESEPAGESGAASDESGEDEDAAEEAEDSGAAERLANAVAADARLSPWLFRISDAKFEDMTRRMEDLLEPEEDADE